jgi:hypothetical protein
MKLPWDVALPASNEYEGENSGTEPEPSCSDKGEQMAEVCLPISVKPFANVGKIVVKCCGKAIIVPGTNICKGTPDGNCDFTITQKICVEVPVEFGADVTPGDVHVACDGNNCENCEDSKQNPGSPVEQ